MQIIYGIFAIALGILGNNLLLTALIITLFVIQIISLKRFKKTSGQKYWGTYLGISIANLIALPFIYSITGLKALGLDGAIITLFTGGVLLILDIVMLTIGIVTKIEKKVPNVKAGLRCLITMIVVSIAYFIVLYGVGFIRNRITFNSDNKIISNYLNEKYGLTDCNIITSYQHTESTGVWEKELTGNYYKVNCDIMENPFHVLVNLNSTIKYDSFMPIYYSSEYIPKKLGKPALNFSEKYYEYYTEVDDDYTELEDFMLAYINENLLEENETPLEYPYYSGRSKYLINAVSDTYGRIPEIDEYAKMIMRQIKTDY